MLMPDEDARPGIKLEFIRRQKGISRKELADKLEIAPGALFNLENGFNPIHFDDALKLGNLCMGGIGNCFCCSSGFARYRIPSGQGIE